MKSITRQVQCHILFSNARASTVVRTPGSLQTTWREPHKATTPRRDARRHEAPSLLVQRVAGLVDRPHQALGRCPGGGSRDPLQNMDRGGGGACRQPESRSTGPPPAPLRRGAPRVGVGGTMFLHSGSDVRSIEIPPDTGRACLAHLDQTQSVFLGRSDGCVETCFAIPAPMLARMPMLQVPRRSGGSAWSIEIPPDNGRARLAILDTTVCLSGPFRSRTPAKATLHREVGHQHISKCSTTASGSPHASGFSLTELRACHGRPAGTIRHPLAHPHASVGDRPSSSSCGGLPVDTHPNRALHEVAAVEARRHAHVGGVRAAGEGVHADILARMQGRA